MKVFNTTFDGKKMSFAFVEDKIEAEQICHKLKKVSGVFGLDLETAKLEGYEDWDESTGIKPGLDPYLSKIRLVQIWTGNRGYVFDVFKTGLGVLEELFYRVPGFVAHNAVFELLQLTHAGFMRMNIDCSMIMSMLVDHAEHSMYEKAEDEEPDGLSEYAKARGFGLDAVIGRIFKLKVEKHFQTSDWGTELTKEQVLYAGLDAYLTWKLYKEFYPYIQKMGMLKIYSLYKQMQYVVCDMQLNGIELDTEAHKKLIKEWENDRTRAERECRRFYGELNLRSPRQLGRWLEEKFKDKPKVLQQWPKTEKGSYSFGRIKIGKYAKIPWIACYLDYKKYDKLLNTYGTSLLRKIHPVTNRLHGSFSIGRTATGRLSSYAPNLQNLPRDVAVRHVFKACAGSKLVVADYSQIEIRVAAELAKEERTKAWFKEKEDLHKKIAAFISGKKEKDITKEDRQLGKAVNFGLMFGMGPRKLSEYAELSYGVALSEGDAKRAYDIFHNKMYPKYSAWCGLQRKNCERLGFVRTPLGKIRKLGEDEVYTKAVNTPVQGGAAEVCMAALVILSNTLFNKDSEIKIVNTVHDEIILEVPKGQIAYAKELLQKCMHQGMRYVFPEAGLEYLTEAGAGDDWEEAKT